MGVCLIGNCEKCHKRGRVDKDSNLCDHCLWRVLGEQIPDRPVSPDLERLADEAEREAMEAVSAFLGEPRAPSVPRASQHAPEAVLASWASGHDFDHKTRKCRRCGKSEILLRSDVSLSFSGNCRKASPPPPPPKKAR